MLLNLKKSTKPGDVVAFKLLTGLEIIGKLVSSNDKGFVLDRPVVLQMAPGQGGQAHVTFGPFMIGCELENEYEIDYAKVLFPPVPAREDAAKQYLQATTGIAL